MSDTGSQPEQLYAAREPVFPRKVYGPFRNLKWGIMIVTRGIYYLTPWIRWDRGPNLPDQAVLVDMANRRFFFFWIEIWPHEFYFVARNRNLRASIFCCRCRRSRALRSPSIQRSTTRNRSVQTVCGHVYPHQARPTTDVTRNRPMPAMTRRPATKKNSCGQISMKKK